MNRNMLLIGGLILVLLVGGLLIVNNSRQPAPTTTTESTSDQTTPDNMMDTDSTTPTTGTESTNSGSAEETGSVKEFTVMGSGFKFEPATLTVNKGDKVKITFKNTGGTHDFVIDELDIKTPLTQSDQEEIVEFTADQAGSFEYYCSVGNHRQMGMKGTLVVK